MKKGDKICFLSVDVEHDHPQLDFHRTFNGVEKMGEIVGAFDELSVSSTLFFTGEALERFPRLAKEFSQKHEIASHSYSHTFFNEMHVSDIVNDLGKFTNLYKNVLGVSPKGFRAPSHIIGSAHMRAVSDCGFLYDSSIVPHYPPFKKYRGYSGKAPKHPYRPSENSCRTEGELGIVELPVAGHLAGLPLAGAWIRGLPLGIYKFLFLFKSPQYISLSFHSWDILHSLSFKDELCDLILYLKKSGYEFKRGDQILGAYV